MTDVKSPALLYLKGGLFVVIGCASAALVLVELPSLKVAALLAVCVWSFCRAYYFAFYVIERYIDPQFRFAGLSSVALYLLRRRRAQDGDSSAAG